MSARKRQTPEPEGETWEPQVDAAPEVEEVQSSFICGVQIGGSAEGWRGYAANVLTLSARDAEDATHIENSGVGLYVGNIEGNAVLDTNPVAWFRSEEALILADQLRTAATRCVVAMGKTPTIESDS